MTQIAHHHVQPGDTVSAIARRHGSTHEAIRLANRQIADIDLIRVGDVLHVPIPVQTAPTLPGWAEWYAGSVDFAEVDSEVSVRNTTELRGALGRSGTRVVLAADIMPAGPIETAANDLILDGQGHSIHGGTLRFNGTRIIVQDVTVGPQTSTNADCITFRNPSETQVFALRRVTLTGATDGCLDVIWNRGHDVYGTVEDCEFYRTDKACLVHSGDDHLEGGRYHMTFRNNGWHDCIQRMPMARDCDLHIVGGWITAFGGAVGDGNGVQVSRGNSRALIERLHVIPRVAGSTTFDGTTVTKPRMMAAKATDPSAAVRIVDPVLDGGAEVLEQNPELVETPPYATQEAA